MTREEERVEQWRVVWTALYAKKLPRAEHDARRDEMFAWSDARGDVERRACREGQLKSTFKYEEDDSIPFGRD